MNQRVSSTIARKLDYLSSSAGDELEDVDTGNDEDEDGLFFSLDSLTLHDDSSTPASGKTPTVDDSTWIAWSGASTELTPDMRVLVYSVIGSKDGRVQCGALSEMLPGDVYN